MSKEKIYIATIQIAVVAPSEEEAYELIGYKLDDLRFKKHGAILDWQYDSENGVFAEKGEYNPDDYEKGQAFIDHFIERVKDALREGKKLLAVKIYKDATGAGLKESKEFVDTLCPEFLKKNEEYRSGFHTDTNGDLLHTF